MLARTSNDFGIFIREQRRARGWDQAELAKQIGVSRHWVVDIEKGRPGAELGLVLRALRALEVELHLEAPRTDDDSPDPLTAVLERARERDG
jgi:HTH-type transcriptional regulator / antitoxin HipB